MFVQNTRTGKTLPNCQSTDTSTNQYAMLIKQWFKSGVLKVFEERAALHFFELEQAA